MKIQISSKFNINEKNESGAAVSNDWYAILCYLILIFF